MKILIIGTGSLLNYGCEAIVQGTYVIIKHFIPDAQIYLASEDKTYDRKFLPADIHLITYKQRFTFYRVWKGILRRIFHIGTGSAVRMNCNVAKKYDFVLSCGGDNFCETPDGTIYTLLEDLMKVGDIAYKYHRKYVLWGASVGPFTRKINYERVIDNLKKTNLICVREQLSYQYLTQEKTLNNKAKLVADPAFCMQPDTNIEFKKESGYIYIGLNVSELSVSHTMKAEERADFIRQLFEKFDDILQSYPNYRFVCIPHVVIPGGFVQDDGAFLRQYVNVTRYSNRVEILSGGIGAAKTKAYIAQMDLLVAARMHCCVGGISTATPTLFVTYSNKGKGMSYYAYKHHDYEIEVPELISPRFPDLLNLMVQQRNGIRRCLMDRQQDFQADAMRGGEYLKLLLGQ